MSAPTMFDDIPGQHAPDVPLPIWTPPVHKRHRWWLDAADTPNVWHTWAGWIANRPRHIHTAAWRWWVWYGHIRLVDELERVLMGALFDSGGEYG